jgi:hypothetical protein
MVLVGGITMVFGTQTKMKQAEIEMKGWQAQNKMSGADLLKQFPNLLQMNKVCGISASIRPIDQQSANFLWEYPSGKIDITAPKTVVNQMVDGMMNVCYRLHGTFAKSEEKRRTDF